MAKTMFIGALKIELFLPCVHSLKAKRQVLNSIKEKVRNNFNVAIAEESFDKWQRAAVFIVGVNGKKPNLEKAFSSIENMLYSYKDVEVINVEQDFF